MILFSGKRDTLLRPLQAVSGIVERRHTLPILSNVLLQRKENVVALTATDIEIQVDTSFACDSPGDDGAVTVSARKLQDILRALPDDAELTLEVKDRRIQVRSGRSRFFLQSLAAEDFPRVNRSGAITAKFKLTQARLKRLFALVQYAMAVQDIRYYLNGLLLVAENESLSAVATDGHRLAVAVSSQTLSVREKVEVILPRKAVTEVFRLLGEVEEEVDVELDVGQARISFDKIELCSKLIDGRFPEYERVIPSGALRTVRVGRLQLLQTLQRAAILTSEKFKGVRCVLSDGVLRIVSSNTEQEEAQEELPVAFTGEALDIGFNVTYLLDVLDNLDTEEVEWNFGAANSSSLITIPGRTDFKYVVMPMRI
jgi:DNA polymerase-3 subunit beta